MGKVGKKMYHVIYKTTRPSTGQYYIGKHSTNNLDDGYQGSGKRVKAILKKEECTTEILHYCNTEEEAYELEEDIVNLEMLSDPLCLNLVVGGYGLCSGENHPMFGMTGEKSHHFGKPRSDETKIKISEANGGENHPLFGKTPSEDTKMKLREAKEGEKNPKFKGYYHTPFGVFSSLMSAAEAEKCAHSTIWDRVKNDNFKDYWLEPVEKGVATIIL